MNPWTRLKTPFGCAFALLLAWPQTSYAAPQWFSRDNNTALSQAHEAFLRGDLKAMTSRIKEVFEDPRTDELSRANALTLLGKAYSVSGEKPIPVDWKLPAEITRMKVTLRRCRRQDREDYALKVSGHSATKGLVKQLQIVKYPDTVVLDKEKKIGAWMEAFPFGEKDEFELDGPRTAEPVGEGLYLLNLELADGRSTRGWFILSDLVSSDTPVIRYPSAGQTIKSANPTVRWEDFKSPEYQEGEFRSLWLSVVRSEPPQYDWQEVWQKWEADPSETETIIGEDPHAEGVKRLENGRYTFYVSFKEHRRFGELALGRQSVTVVPFIVKAR